VVSLTPELEEHQHGPGPGGRSTIPSSALKQGQKEQEKGLIPPALVYTSPAHLMGSSCCAQPASLPQIFLPPSCPWRGEEWQQIPKLGDRRREQRVFQWLVTGRGQA